jgi:hypothetical protein
MHLMLQAVRPQSQWAFFEHWVALASVVFFFPVIIGPKLPGKSFVFSVFFCSIQTTDRQSVHTTVGMEQGLSFPCSEVIERDELPEGYPYVCPKCGVVLPDVFWSREQAEFAQGDSLVLTLCREGMMLVVLLNDSDHCRVSLFSVLHEC